MDHVQYSGIALVVPRASLPVTRSGWDYPIYCIVSSMWSAYRVRSLSDTVTWNTAGRSARGARCLGPGRTGTNGG